MFWLEVLSKGGVGLSAAFDDTVEAECGGLVCMGPCEGWQQAGMDPAGAASETGRLQCLGAPTYQLAGRLACVWTEAVT